MFLWVRSIVHAHCEAYAIKRCITIGSIMVKTILLLGCSGLSVFYRKGLVSDKALRRHHVCMAEFSWGSETNF